VVTSLRYYLSCGSKLYILLKISSISLTLNKIVSFKTVLRTLPTVLSVKSIINSVFINIGQDSAKLVSNGAIRRKKNKNRDKHYFIGTLVRLSLRRLRHNATLRIFNKGVLLDVQRLQVRGYCYGSEYNQGDMMRLLDFKDTIYKAETTLIKSIKNDK